MLENPLNIKKTDQLMDYLENLYKQVPAPVMCSREWNKQTPTVIHLHPETGRLMLERPWGNGIAIYFYTKLDRGEAEELAIYLKKIQWEGLKIYAA